MSSKLDSNKQNIMKQTFLMIKAIEEIIFNNQYELSFFNNKDLKQLEYCNKNIESLLEAKEIYNNKKIG